MESHLLGAWKRALTQPGPKHHRNGTHRTRIPSETVARVTPLLRDMGITRVANVTGLDRIGIPVVMVCRPNSRSLAVSQGKGLMLDAAKASGIMEAVELYQAERIDVPLRLASYREMREHYPVVDVMQLPRTPQTIYHDDLAMLWIEGLDVIHREPVWAPFEVVHTNYTLPFPTGSGSFVASSNGLASGNTLLEAVSHAICEVVERDASTLWEMSKKRHERQVDLSSVTDAGCLDVLARFAAAEVDVEVFETTSDVGLPSFFCFITDIAILAIPVRRHAVGMGCHVSRNVALLRALTEAAQSRLTVIAGSRDDLVRGEYEDMFTFRAARTNGLSTRKGRSIAEVPDYDTETLRDDIELQLSRLEKVGIDRAVVFDLSDQRHPFSVARVVIPGLEGSTDSHALLPGPRARAAAEQPA
ncbi:MAG: hypothetical protein QOI11_1428 [Candidatus Eremiobacteraeota bacterium]|nr:hypothetical protein [Candidatus Eremiobacteraeota bacterium]